MDTTNRKNDMERVPPKVGPRHVGMLSVGASLLVVESAITSRALPVFVAAVNGPRSVVLAGALDDLTELQEYFTSAGLRATLVPVPSTARVSELVNATAPNQA